MAEGDATMFQILSGGWFVGRVVMEDHHDRGEEADKYTYLSKHHFRMLYKMAANVANYIYDG